MIVAIDQYGEKVYLPGKHPRKELLDKLGYKHADKMYMDRKDGTAVHLGYIINGRWFSFWKRLEDGDLRGSK